MSKSPDADQAVVDEPTDVNVDYMNGSPALRFTAGGAGFAYYPSEPGEEPRVAVCVSKVNSYQNKYFFYDNSSQTHRYAGKEFQIPKTLLCSINEHVVGHARAKSRSLPLGQVRTFLMSADGGTMTDSKNHIIRKWLWDASRQNAGTPPSGAVEIRLNKYMRFKFVDRATATVTFKCESVKREFDCGEKLRRLDSYLDSSSAVKYGELRGKRVIPMETPTLLQRQQEFFEAMRHKTILLYPDSNRIRHPELRGVMAGLENHFEPYERKISEGTYTTTPYATEGWREDALAQTMMEVPQFNGSTTDLGKTLPASFNTDPVTLGETAKLGQTTRTDPGGGGFNATMRTTKTVFGDTGGLSGIAKDGDRWLGELDVRKAIANRHPVLTRSVQLKNASGRYSVDAPVDGKAPPFKKLPLVSRAQFDDFLSNMVPPQQLVLVACLREDDPACRNATQIMEHVNGTLAQRFPADEVTGENKAPYRVVKFDMTSSRYLTKRFGIHTLPMYLMFLNAKLVYAGTLGGAKVRMPGLDLKANYMVLDQDARSQMAIEKVLRKLRVDWDLACTVNNAMNQSKRLAENQSKAGPKRRYGALATSHAVVFASCDFSTSDLKPLQQALQRRARGASATTGFGGAKLLGDSLVAITHPIGTVKPARSMCAMCMAAVEGHKGKKVDPATLAADADEAAGGAGQAWMCPRCAVVQNVTAELLGGGFGSVAVIKPLKPATARTLAKLWKTLQTKRALENTMRTQRKKKGPTSVLHPEEESDQDGAHLGITHDDVLRQLKKQAEAGKRGQFLPADFKFGLSLSAQDTVYKGVRLTRSRKKL